MLSLLLFSATVFGASVQPLTVRVPSLQADGQLHILNVAFTSADGTPLVEQKFRIVLPLRAGIPAVVLLKDEAASAAVAAARAVIVRISVDGVNVQTATLADLQRGDAKGRGDTPALDTAKPKRRDRTATITIGGNVSEPRQKTAGEKFREVIVNNIAPPPNFVCPNLEPCEEEFNYWFWEGHCDQYDPYYNCQAVRERYEACVWGEWTGYYEEETILFQYPIYTVPFPICDTYATKEYLAYTRGTHYESGQVRYCPSVGEFFTIVVEERTETETCYKLINPYACPPNHPTLIDPGEECIIP